MTMFATNDRVRPCSARCARSSSGRRDDDLLAFVRDGDVGRRDVLQRALGTLDGHVAPVDRHLDAARDGDGLLADAGHRVTRPDRGSRRRRGARRASRSVRSPWFVERIAMPMPPSTRGTSVGLGVDPQTRLRHPPKTRDRALALRRVLERDSQLATRPRRVGLDRVARDVPLAAGGCPPAPP